MAFEYPAFGQVRASNELAKQGITVSPGGIRSIWLRNDLESFKKRLKALEVRVSQEGGVLTESQVQALERAKEEKVAKGEIETHHPGYLGSQDTYYVGNVKGVGRIYPGGDHNKPILIPTVKLLMQNYILTKMPLQQLICLTIECCLCMKNKMFDYSEY